ncbi:uncharacterized protein LOC132259191 [Phlebotomus argentipes]|uniref:uncharacterized protein LOC132259191 n=1 Tax=Phlebotomus argentipes TaxID=94469 RepID=UPI00289364FB|nr:uncharacterized protein LOC132259191 [Phlebotomus argentipes]
MLDHLKDLLTEIHERNQSDEVLVHEEEFLLQLQQLSSWEKICIGKQLYACEWQVGSPHLMSLLQQEGLFNVCLYLSNLDSANEADNILNDLLEVEHSLLAEVVLSAGIESPQTEKLVCLLERCCENALKDLLANPSLKIPNYLHCLEAFLRDADLQQFRDMHLTILTSIHESKIVHALKSQKCWISEDALVRNSSLEELLRQMIKKPRQSLDLLLKLMTKTNFSGWKFFLAVINMIVRTASQEDYLHFKKYLEGFFWKACSARSEHQFQIFLLLARETSYAFGERKKATYLAWYKATISQMTYKLQPEDFKIILSFLADLARLEEDMDFLDVHINSAVPAPPRCNELVLDFKQLTRIRHCELLPLNECTQEDCVVFID